MATAPDKLRSYATRTPQAAEHVTDWEIAAILQAGSAGMLKASPQHGAATSAAPFVNRIALETFGSAQAGLEDSGVVTNQFIVQHPREGTEDFLVRLMLLEYDDIYWRAARQLAAKPFSKDIGWSDETPESVIEWTSNIEIPDASATVSGVDFRTFARNACTQSAGFGSTVLYPQVSEAGDRAYLTTIPITAIRGVRYRNEAGFRRESRVIVRTRKVKDAAENGFVDMRKQGFHETYEDVVYIFYDGEPGSSLDARFAGFETYVKDPQTGWPKNPTIPWQPIRPLIEIPLVPLGCGPGHNWFRPPIMRHLARSERVLINKVSDFNHSMKTASVPIWSWSGLSKQELRKYTALNAGNVFRSDQSGARMEPVEFQGGAMRIYAENIEGHRSALHGMAAAPMRTQAQGMNPQVRETATKTATNYAENMTESEAAALEWEAQLERAVKIGARRTNMTEEQVDQISLQIFHDFQVSQAQAEKVDKWTELMLADKMPPDEYYGLLDEIGWLSEDFDTEHTLEWIEEQEARAMERMAQMSRSLRQGESDPSSETPEETEPTPETEEAA